MTLVAVLGRTLPGRASRGCDCRNAAPELRVNNLYPFRTGEALADRLRARTDPRFRLRQRVDRSGVLFDRTARRNGLCHRDRRVRSAVPRRSLADAYALRATSAGAWCSACSRSLSHRLVSADTADVEKIGNERSGRSLRSPSRYQQRGRWLRQRGQQRGLDGTPPFISDNPLPYTRPSNDHEVYAEVMNDVCDGGIHP